MAFLNPVARQIDPELHAITAWLQGPESDHFLVTSHVNPDGDGLASMLTCGRILRRLSKQVWLVTDGFLSPRYGYLPQIDTVVSYREGLEAELPVANVITVDVPTLSRLERMDGFVDYAVSLQGVEVAVFLREHEPGQIRISLRAKHDVDVRAVAEVFGGGGHRKSAGARMTGTLAEAKARLVHEIQRHLEPSNERSA